MRYREAVGQQTRTLQTPQEQQAEILIRYMSSSPAGARAVRAAKANTPFELPELTQRRCDAKKQHVF